VIAVVEGRVIEIESDDDDDGDDDSASVTRSELSDAIMSAN